MRTLHARQRKEELRGNKCRAQIEVGDIVTCRYRSVPSKLGAHKLQKRYRYLFTVVYVQGSTAFIRPYSLGALERYLKFTDYAHRAPLPTPTLPTFKVSVIDLKRVYGGLQLYTNNNKNCYFSEFSMPEPRRQLKVNLYTPIDPRPDLWGDEDVQDQYSDYQGIEDDGAMEHLQAQEEQKFRRSGQRTFNMDDSGEWIDSETGSADEEPWLVRGDDDPAGEDSSPGDVHPRPADQQERPRLPKPTDVGLSPEFYDGEVAGDEVRLNTPSPQRLRRSCRKRKIPLRLQQVSKGVSVRTTDARGSPRKIQPEEWREWLKRVKCFFEYSASGNGLDSTVRAINIYDELIQKLDNKAMTDRDACTPTKSANCGCMECKFNSKFSQCNTQRCRLCKR